MLKTIVIFVTTVSILGGKLNDLSVLKAECQAITKKFSEVLADLGKSYSYVRDPGNVIKEVNVKEKMISKVPSLKETIFSAINAKPTTSKTALNPEEKKQLINDLFELNGNLIFSLSAKYMREESFSSASTSSGVYRGLIDKCWAKMSSTAYHFRFMHSAEEIWGKNIVSEGKLKKYQEEIFKEDDELNEKWKQFENLFGAEADFGKTLVTCEHIKAAFKEIKMPVEVEGKKICEGKNSETLPFSKIFPTMMQPYKNWYRVSFWMKLNAAHKTGYEAYLAWVLMNQQLKRDAEQQALAEKAPLGKFKPSNAYFGEEAIPAVVAKIEAKLRTGLLDTVKLLNSPETKEFALLDMFHRKLGISPDWSATLTPATKFDSAGATTEAIEAAQKKILDEYKAALEKPSKETIEKATTFLKPVYSTLAYLFNKVYRLGQHKVIMQEQCPLVDEFLNFSSDRMNQMLEFGYKFCEDSVNSLRANWENSSDKNLKTETAKGESDYEKFTKYYLAAMESKGTSATTADYPFNIYSPLKLAYGASKNEPNSKETFEKKLNQAPFNTIFPDGIDSFQSHAVYKYGIKTQDNEQQKLKEIEKAKTEIKKDLKIGWDMAAAAYKNLMDYVDLKVLGQNQCASRNFLITARETWEKYTNRRFIEDQATVLEDYHQTYFLPSFSVDIDSAAKKATEDKSEVDHCYENRKFVMNFKLEHQLNYAPRDPKDKKPITVKLDELCGLYTPFDVSKIAKEDAAKKAKIEDYNKPRKLPKVHIYVRELLSKDESGKMKFGEIIHENLIDLNEVKISGGTKPQTLNEFIYSKCCTRPPKDQEANAGNTWINDLKTVFKFEFNFKGIPVSKGKSTVKDAEGKEKTVDVEFFHGKGEAFEDADFPEYVGMTCSDFWTSKFTHEYFTILEHHRGKKELYKAAVTNEITIDHDAAEFYGQSLLVTFPVLASDKKDPLKFQTVFRTKPAKIDDFFDYTDKTATDYGKDLTKCPTFIKEMGVYSKFSSFSFAKLFEKFNEQTIKIEQKGSKKYKDIVSTSTKVTEEENVDIPITVINIPISGFLSNKKTEVTATRENALDYQAARAELLKDKRNLQDLF